MLLSDRSDSEHARTDASDVEEPPPSQDPNEQQNFHPGPAPLFLRAVPVFPAQFYCTVFTNLLTPFNTL